MMKKAKKCQYIVKDIRKGMSIRQDLIPGDVFKSDCGQQSF